MKRVTLSDLPPPPAGKHGWPWTEARAVESAIPPEAPRISVVTPVLNRVDFIEETIRSVLLQGYPNLEYGVVDGGSTDGTLDVIERYAPWLQYWVSEPDEGQSQAINRGWARASGDLLAWLNADDFYAPGALARVAAAYLAGPEVGFYYGDCAVVQAWNGVVVRKPAAAPTWTALLTGDNPVHQPSAFLTTATRRAIGGIDESLHLAMDYDLWLRAFRHRGARLVAGEPLAFVHDHPGSKTRAEGDGYQRELPRVLDRFFAADPPPQAAALRRSAYAHVYYVCAGAALYQRRDVLRASRLMLQALQEAPSVVTRFPRDVWQRLGPGGSRVAAQ